MKISRIKYKFILAATVLILSACAQTPDKTTVDNEQQKQTSTETSKAHSMSVSKSERDRYREGLAALNNNDIAKAQRIFTEFIRKQPELAGAYSNLAVIHFKKNELEKSLKLLNKAIELNPKQSQAYNLRAQIMVKHGKIQQAKIDYTKAIELNPKYVNAQYNLALLYDIYLQEIELAIKHYEIYMSLIKIPDPATKDWIIHLKGTLNNG